MYPIPNQEKARGSVEDVNSVNPANAVEAVRFVTRWMGNSILRIRREPVRKGEHGFALSMKYMRCAGNICIYAPKCIQ